MCRFTAPSAASSEFTITGAVRNVITSLPSTVFVDTIQSPRPELGTLPRTP